MLMSRVERHQLPIPYFCICFCWFVLGFYLLRNGLDWLLISFLGYIMAFGTNSVGFGSLFFMIRNLPANSLALLRMGTAGPQRERFITTCLSTVRAIQIEFRLLAMT